MNNESWYAAKLSDMDVVRTHDSDDFVVDYDKSRGMYKVTIFKDGHFWDEVWFDVYEEKECREHGHWILRVENNTCDMTYQYECSKCKQSLKQKNITNFCPNCGIIMDEEIERA